MTPPGSCQPAGRRRSRRRAPGSGFSVNGGTSFTDLGGLPNLDCHKYLYEGDPSVVAYRVGGHDYFYISSLYDSVNGLGAVQDRARRVRGERLRQHGGSEVREAGDHGHQHPMPKGQDIPDPDR